MPLYPEPKAKNLYSVPPKSWLFLSEPERHFYNKIFGYMFENMEEFSPDRRFTSLEWGLFCHKVALLGCNIFKRGRRLEYWTPKAFKNRKEKE